MSDSDEMLDSTNNLLDLLLDAKPIAEGSLTKNDGGQSTRTVVNPETGLEELSESIEEDSKCGDFDEAMSTESEKANNNLNEIVEGFLGNSGR